MTSEYTRRAVYWTGVGQNIGCNNFGYWIGAHQHVCKDDGRILDIRMTDFWTRKQWDSGRRIANIRQEDIRILQWRTTANIGEEGGTVF
jgi:hypothetical protein